MDPRLPDTPWFEELKWAAAIVGAAITTWRLAISKKAVEGAKIVATIALVEKIDGRVKTLEETSIRSDGRLGSIESTMDKIEKKAQDTNDTTHEILGELRGSRGQRR